MNFFWPWAGILPALVTFSAMYFNGLDEAGKRASRLTLISVSMLFRSA
jgi:hypothetical protein